MSASAPQLPPIRMRTRVRRVLRGMKKHWRVVSAGPLPAWAQTEPVAAVFSDTGHAHITAQSAPQLRAPLDGDPVTSDLTVRVLDWSAPWSGWSGRLGRLPGVVRLRADLPSSHGEASVHIRLSKPLPVQRILTAVLSMLEPSHCPGAQVSPSLALSGQTPPWLPAGAQLGEQSPLASSTIRPHDLQLAAEDATAGGLPVVTRYGITTAEGRQVTIVDTASAHPRGRQAYSRDLRSGILRVTGTTQAPAWRIEQTDGKPVPVVAGRVGDPLDPRQTAVLRRLRSVSVEVSESSPSAQAATVAQLAMTGLVLHAPDLDDRVGSLLAQELATVIRAATPDPRADALEWEARSVAQRREAMRHHAPEFALPWSRPPAMTALLVTKRPQRIQTVIADLAKQTYPELEIVLVSHGFELAAGECDQLRAHGLPTTVLCVPDGQNLGEALGIASRAATGTLLTKVDDDDHYGPEHLWDLVLAWHYSGATVVGKGAEFVYLEPYDSTVRRRMASELYTDVVAGGTMLISRSDLEEVGGWRPLPRSVDRGLLDRVLTGGGLIYRTHGLGFIYTRHSEGHTWDAGPGYFVQDPLKSWQGLPPHEEFGTR